MLQLLILLLCGGFFALQLVLCVYCRNWLRYALLCFLGGLELALWGSFFLIRPGFYTYYIGILGLFGLAAVLLAWGLWTVVQRIQKRK